MSSNVPIAAANDLTAPTPQNTPLNQAPISLGLSRPTVPDISEETEPQDKDAAAGIAGLVTDKMNELLGASSGYLESLPLDVKLNVEGLKGVQTKYVELQAAFKKECLELEKKVCFLFFCAHRILALFCRLSKLIGYCSISNSHNRSMSGERPLSPAQLLLLRKRSPPVKPLKRRKMRTMRPSLAMPPPPPMASPSSG